MLRVAGENHRGKSKKNGRKKGRKKRREWGGLKDSKCLRVPLHRALGQMSKRKGCKKRGLG